MYSVHEDAIELVVARGEVEAGKVEVVWIDMVIEAPPQHSVEAAAGGRSSETGCKSTMLAISRPYLDVRE